MNYEAVAVLTLIIALACGVGAAVVGEKKGQSGALWFLLGFLFPPLGLLAILAMPGETAPRRALSDFIALRPCPSCGEPVRGEATQCRHCQSAIDREPVTPVRERPMAGVPPEAPGRECPFCRFRIEPDLPAGEACPQCGQPLPAGQGRPTDRSWFEIRLHAPNGTQRRLATVQGLEATKSRRAALVEASLVGTLVVIEAASRRVVTQEELGEAAPPGRSAPHRE